ncbi:MAG: hypothetical protein LBG77_03880 [Dysgonamonadaceae bacterium]|jgi:hypothetical protein|nr:hypothetical protein [Dysgonamonadaceae bacterium]
MKKLLCLFCLSGWAIALTAQTNYLPGYIITLENDTLFGQIDYRDDYTLGSICRFEDQQGVKTEFSPNEIVAYRFIDSRYFVSKAIDRQKYFLEFLISGRMNVYYLRDSKGDHYFMDKGNDQLTKIPYTDEIRYSQKHGEYHYRSTLHNGILSYYMQDAPQLQKKIYQIKEPNHQSLITLAKNYHYAVCEENEECMVFVHPTPFIKIQAEPFVGYSMMVENASAGLLWIGANIYFWLPRTNENWYF